MLNEHSHEHALDGNVDNGFGGGEPGLAGVKAVLREDDATMDSIRADLVA
jgi:hypothetical protein